MSKVAALIEGLCRAGAFISALCMALIVLLIILEIFLRSVFGLSTLVSSEFSGYLLVGLVAMGLAYTLQHEAHIRITLVWNQLPQKWQKMVDILIGSTSFLITCFIIYHTVILVSKTYQRGITADTVVQTPLWIPQTAIPLGFILLLLQLINFIMRRINP